LKRAADPKAFPEQIEGLGLQAWMPDKLYAVSGDKGKAKVVQVNTEPSDRLMASPRDFATPAAGLLGDGSVLLPAERYFSLLATHFPSAGKLHDATTRGELMDGIVLAPGGEARRKLPEVA